MPYLPSGIPSTQDQWPAATRAIFRCEVCEIASADRLHGDDGLALKLRYEKEQRVHCLGLSV